MPVINCYNEDENCDNCGNPPVEFVICEDDNNIEKLCVECFSVRIAPKNQIGEL